MNAMFSQSKTVWYAALAVAILVAACAQPASASIFDKIRGGMVTALQDDDFEILVDTNGNGAVDVGEVLVAILKIPSFEDTNGNPYATFDKTTRMVTGVSLSKVLSVTVSGTNAEFDLGAADAADWTALGLAAPVHAGTILIGYDDPPSDPDPHIVNTDVASGLASATEGIKVSEFGFRGDADEFFKAFTSTLAGGDPTRLTDITSLTVIANMNQTDGTLQLLKHNFLGSPASGLPGFLKPLFTGPAELQLQGALGTISPGGWAISTDTDLYVFSAVPEPTSLASFGLLAGIAAVAMMRRKKKAA